MTTACDVSIRRKNERFFLFLGLKLILYYLAALRIEKRLQDIDTIEEEEITLEVVLSKPDARGKWLKDGKILYPDQKYILNLSIINEIFSFYF
jgi:hypothetical protein